MSTVFPTKQGIERNWHVVDANDVVLGKLASHAARLLMGKHKTTWTPFIDTGDHVVVINAEKVKLTGKKTPRNCTGTSPVIRVDWLKPALRKFAPAVPPV